MELPVDETKCNALLGFSSAQPVRLDTLHEDLVALGRKIDEGFDSLNKSVENLNNVVGMVVVISFLSFISIVGVGILTIKSK